MFVRHNSVSDCKAGNCTLCEGPHHSMVCKKLQADNKSNSEKEDKDENGNRGKDSETGDKETLVVAIWTFKYNTESVETPAGWKEIGNNLRKSLGNGIKNLLVKSLSVSPHIISGPTLKPKNN